MRKIALLGSTGSIGTGTLEVIGQNRDQFKLIGIAAGENIQLLESQIKTFLPNIVTVKRKKDAESLKTKFPGIRFLYGKDGLAEVVSHPDVDTMVSAIDGTTALEATLISIDRNHRICLANKETLVAAGEMINDALHRSNAELIPIDSEQSAIFQSLGFNQKDFVKKVILTASGGPFFKKNKDEFDRITVKEALAHPTWTMGTKITIDSASLMNKALEVIEAYYLFHLKPDQIDVVIHPQSIVHSMVEYVDSSIIAQLSVPDMRIPILYSLSYPRRIQFDNNPLNFATMGNLEFYPVDIEKFRSIKMAYHVLREGKNAGAVLNAANEVAVDYFLKEKISFSDIYSVVEQIFYNENFYPMHSLEDINETIETTKRKTQAHIENRTSIAGKGERK